MTPYLCPVVQSAQRAPDATAILFGHRLWTWWQLERDVTDAAGWLEEQGVRAGDRIACVSWNRPEVVIAFHAAARLGAVWVPLNARLTAQEHAALLSRIRPVLTLADEPFVRTLPGATPLTQISRDPLRLTAPHVRAADSSAVRAILFTSGTTGVSKGAELTYGNFDALAAANAVNLGGDPDQRWLGTLPLFHVGGLTMAHRCAVYGATLVLHDRFDAARVARSLREERITHASLVATGLRWLLDHGEPRAPESLRALLIGGGPAPAELLAHARERGYPVLQTYGLTETCSQAATERLDEADGLTAGRALDGTEVRVVNGEIEVRGPTVMRGYFEDPESTARVLKDGWLRTGDLGELDERGRLKILSRRTDLIVSGGENVYPAEIEAVLSTHPAIAEVAVLGLSDDTWGQIPAALIVPRGDTEVAEEIGAALSAWCRERLAGFKVPRRFIRIEALPKTANGKVDRGRLNALVAAEVQQVQEVQAVQRGERT